MTIPQLISGEADAAAQRYDLLTDAFRTIYLQTISQSSFGSERQFERASSDAYTAAVTYLGSERLHISRITDAVSSEALRATLHELSVDTAPDVQERIDEHLSVLEDHLSREITIQIERDIAMMKRSLRRAYLSVDLAARGSRISNRAALNYYRMAGTGGPEFAFHDRGNRRWPSRRFIRGVFRTHLLSVYNETVLIALAEHGVDTAVVQHSNPDAEMHGLLVSLTSNSDLPSYSDIRDDVFHPNADAILRRAL